MGKKKKTYVKPEMKIIEVKTEGVIAASGGGDNRCTGTKLARFLL